MDRSIAERRADGGESGKPPGGPPERGDDPEAGGARPAWLTELRDWTRTLAAVLTVVLLVNAFLFNLSTVEGQSMEPTLESREWLLVNKIVYRFGVPERGDVVILRDPSDGRDQKDYLVKRVVGLPGDTIEVRAGQLYVNGERAVEPYTDGEIEERTYGPVTVGAGSYFLMGDNRHYGASKDSRSFGPVPGSAIKGEAALIVWPIAKWSKL